jgi:hypothetical protein
MDRRRFSPSPERLDSRVLLSGGAQTPQNVPVANFHQKTVKIERLPNALESLQPGRVVPKDVVSGIQADLRAVVGRLNAAPTAALTSAQLQFRSTLANASISTEDAAALRATFRKAIEGTGAPQAVVDDLVSNMDRLTKVDSMGRDPARLIANDYSLILQTVLGVGRPIRKPTIPSLSPADDNGAKGDHATTVTQPRLVGAYDSATTIQLLDETDHVIGTATVGSTGQYSVAPAAPLSIGKHSLRVRAFDANGDSSPPSRAITITIKAPKVAVKLVTTTGTPSGPLGF